MTLCSYWEGCQNPSTHNYGGDDFCDEHDVRTPEEATIDRLRSDLALARDLGYAAAIEDVTTAQRERDEARAEVARITVDRDALRDHAKACAFSLAEELAGEEITRLKALLSRAREALEPLGAVARETFRDESILVRLTFPNGDREVTNRDARTAREVAQEIAKEMGNEPS